MSLERSAVFSSDSAQSSYYSEQKILNNPGGILYCFCIEFGDARKLSRSAQDAIRRMAVQAVVNGGMTQTNAAKVFGASRTSVCLWVKSYRKEGEEALQSKPKGRPKGGKLTSRQMESIRKSVIGKHPDQLRLPGLLWTRDLVRLLILRRFGISLSRWTIGRCLKSWGLLLGALNI